MHLILDRERVRDGARRGEYAAHFFLELAVDGEAPQRVWRGLSHAAALDAARQWTDGGATLVDAYEAGRRERGQA